MACKRCKNSVPKNDLQYIKDYAEQEGKAIDPEKAAKDFVEIIQKIKQRRGLIQRIKEKFGGRTAEEKLLDIGGAEEEVADGIFVKKGIIVRLRDRFSEEKSFNTEGTKTGRVVEEEKDKLFNADGTERKKRKGLFGGRLFGGGFFSKERTEKRREFRVTVSGNRKWIMIGVAVVAVCGTIIYLSITYGGGGFSNIIKMLGAFK